MKQLKTILRESEPRSDEHEFFADAERVGEISKAVYFRACASCGLTRQEARESLAENYQRAGLGHLFPH